MSEQPPQDAPFFDPVPAPLPVEPPPPVYPAFDWEPPHHVVPVPVAVSVELARTEDTLVVLTGLEVFPQGLSYDVRVWLRPGSERHFELPAGAAPGFGDPMAFGDGPRVGWLLEDGTKVGAGVDDPTEPHRVAAADPAAPRLSYRGTSSQSDISSVDQVWLYPLPSGTRWTVVVQWLSRGIPETRTAFDATAVQAAATASAGALWELPPAPEGQEYGWFAYAPASGAVWPVRRTLDPTDPETSSREP